MSIAGRLHVAVVFNRRLSNLNDQENVVRNCVFGGIEIGPRSQEDQVGLGLREETCESRAGRRMPVKPRSRALTWQFLRARSGIEAARIAMRLLKGSVTGNRHRGSRERDADHARTVGVQRVDLSGPAIENGPLIDVALVGNLSLVDRRRKIEDEQS